jgi:hypothetical protein
LKRPSVEANEGLIQQASVQAVNHPIAQVTKYRQVSTGAIIGASSSETTARSSKATSKRVQISVYPILQATKDPTKRFVHRHKRHKRSWQNIMASRSIDASVTANQSPIIPGAKQTCRSQPNIKWSEVLRIDASEHPSDRRRVRLGNRYIQSKKHQNKQKHRSDRPIVQEVTSLEQRHRSEQRSNQMSNSFLIDQNSNDPSDQGSKPASNQRASTQVSKPVSKRPSNPLTKGGSQTDFERSKRAHRSNYAPQYRSRWRSAC